MNTEELNDLTARLNRIEQALDLLVQQRAIKEWYSTAEVAKILGKAEFTRPRMVPTRPGECRKEKMRPRRCK
jgi:hypothetical protein